MTSIQKLIGKKSGEAKIVQGKIVHLYGKWVFFKLS
jgi:hypothetical protein